MARLDIPRTELLGAGQRARTASGSNPDHDLVVALVLVRRPEQRERFLQAESSPRFARVNRAPATNQAGAGRRINLADPQRGRHRCSMRRSDFLPVVCSLARADGFAVAFVLRRRTMRSRPVSRVMVKLIIGDPALAGYLHPERQGRVPLLISDHLIAGRRHAVLRRPAGCGFTSDAELKSLPHVRFTDFQTDRRPGSGHRRLRDRAGAGSCSRSRGQCRMVGERRQVAGFCR